MKDYLYRRKVRYQCRPAYIAVDVLVALAVIFSGVFIFVVPMLVSFFRIVALSRSQVQYFVPRRLEEIKKQSYWNVTMICFEIMIYMILWFAPALLIYNKLSAIVRQYPAFMVLWCVVTIMALFRAALDSEKGAWSGVNENEMTIIGNTRKDLFGYITGFFANGVNIFFGVTIINSTMSDINPWVYQSPIILGLLITTMILIILDVYRCTKRWKITDYNE